MLEILTKIAAPRLQYLQLEYCADAAEDDLMLCVSQRFLRLTFLEIHRYSPRDGGCDTVSSIALHLAKLGNLDTLRVYLEHEDGGALYDSTPIRPNAALLASRLPGLKMWLLQEDGHNAAWVPIGPTTTPNVVQMGDETASACMHASTGTCTSGCVPASLVSTFISDVEIAEAARRGRLAPTADKPRPFAIERVGSRECHASWTDSGISKEWREISNTVGEDEQAGSTSASFMGRFILWLRHPKTCTLFGESIVALGSALQIATILVNPSPTNFLLCAAGGNFMKLIGYAVWFTTHMNQRRGPDLPGPAGRVRRRNRPPDVLALARLPLRARYSLCTPAHLAATVAMMRLATFETWTVPRLTVLAREYAAPNGKQVVLSYKELLDARETGVFGEHFKSKKDQYVALAPRVADVVGRDAEPEASRWDICTNTFWNERHCTQLAGLRDNTAGSTLGSLIDETESLRLITVSQ
ncbi:hypothetical protein EVJ58_g9704 [Rhodofomes roseus]|uniref:Uncharacterized protein n=1 Tax=Rhodofomes roseus TaxID=34475 RepID=A0A4Y9XRN7_9APHY|nr:hypothetical protein EVJ58_g9704 [Rhodofomes roseus]